MMDYFSTYLAEVAWLEGHVNPIVQVQVLSKNETGKTARLNSHGMCASVEGK
jgi:hypothetical protein